MEKRTTFSALFAQLLLLNVRRSMGGFYDSRLMLGRRQKLAVKRKPEIVCRLCETFMHAKHRA